MKIKLAILENDKSYLERIVTVFSTKYVDKFQIYSFTDVDMALASVEKEKVDVLIANDSFEIDAKKLPRRCSFAYFVGSADIGMVNEQRAICKFQKAELIYKQILSIYSENAGSLSGLKLTDDECKITVFSSPCGGVGTSTVAASFALHLAQRGVKTMFLCFENYGDTDAYFSGAGQFDMSDVIFTLKSKKANLALKLESYVKQDLSGVFFFSKAKYSLDMLELNHDERLSLIDELKILGTYEHIVVDLGSFGLDKAHFDYYKKAHNIIMVSDGTENANKKISNSYLALATIDQNQDAPIANRFSLIYNRVSSKTGSTIDGIELRNIGGAPVYSQATTHQIMAKLAENEMFVKIN